MPVLVGGALALFALLLLAALHARWIKAWHGGHRADFPGTGGELARQMLDEAGLRHVGVAWAEEDDFYDPEAGVVWLRQEHLEGRSITAVAIAAHEVGHALQHRDGMALFARRRQLARNVMPFACLAAFLFVEALGLNLGVPPLTTAAVLSGLALPLMLVSIVAELRTLPLETDASFRRALPALARFLTERDARRARSVLRAELLHDVTRAVFRVPRLGGRLVWH